MACGTSAPFCSPRVHDTLLPDMTAILIEVYSGLGWNG